MREKNIVWEPFYIWPEDDFVHPEEDVKDSYEEDNPHQNIMDSMMRLGNVQMTPIGPVEVSTENHPLRNIEFFTGITNFNITISDLNKINAADGVEFLQSLSRYRFVIGVGQLFSVDEVLNNIEACLGIISQNEQLELERNPEIVKIKEFLNQKYGEGNWAAYVYPNGEYEAKLVEDEASLDKVIDTFTSLKRLSDGIIIS